MGSDWEGDSRFESLRGYCDVVYLDRTSGISTTQVKKNLGIIQSGDKTAEVRLEGGEAV